MAKAIDIKQVSKKIHFRDSDKGASLLIKKNYIKAFITIFSLLPNNIAPVMA